MKNITKIIFSFLALSLVLVGCDKEDYTGDSNVDFTAATISSATITASGSNTATYTITGNDVTIDESSIDPMLKGTSAVFNIEVTISTASRIATYIDLTQTGGNVSSGDFSVNKVKIPAGETTGYGSVTIYMTGDIEEVETLELTLNTGSSNIKGAEVFNFTIENDYINTIMSFEFDWSGTYEDESSDSVFDFSKVDMDVVIVDSDFNNISGYDGQTGSCPESIDVSGLADGEYSIYINLYENPFAGFGVDQDLPITISYSQEYFNSGDFFVQGLFNLNQASDSFKFAGSFTVTDGYTYTMNQ